MEKLKRNDEEFQNINITSKELINDYINIFLPLWEEDILKFENFKNTLTPDNIKELSIWSYIGLDEEINYNFKFINETTKSFYVPREKLLLWLENNNLVD